MTRPPSVVTLDIWRVPTSRVPAAVWQMAAGRRRTRRYPGTTFTKFLGTGSGDTFTIRDSDTHHWALLVCWDAEQAAASFAHSRIMASWTRIAEERLHLKLTPLQSRGRWAGQEPFGAPVPHTYEGPVAAITRARLRAASAVTFWRSVPPVSTALHRTPGLLLSLGIGEAPIGLQGTFSAWRSSAALNEFAYESVEHQRVIERTRELDWYAEELFARFALVEAQGTYRGRSIVVPTP